VDYSLATLFNLVAQDSGNRTAGVSYEQPVRGSLPFTALFNETIQQNVQVKENTGTDTNRIFPEPVFPDDHQRFSPPLHFSPETGMPPQRGSSLIQPVHEIHIVPLPETGERVLSGGNGFSLSDPVIITPPDITAAITVDDAQSAQFFSVKPEDRRHFLELELPPADNDMDSARTLIIPACYLPAESGGGDKPESSPVGGSFLIEANDVSTMLGVHILQDRASLPDTAKHDGTFPHDLHFTLVFNRDGHFHVYEMRPDVSADAAVLSGEQVQYIVSRVNRAVHSFYEYESAAVNAVSTEPSSAPRNQNVVVSAAQPDDGRSNVIEERPPALRGTMPDGNYSRGLLLDRIDFEKILAQTAEYDREIPLYVHHFSDSDQTVTVSVEPCAVKIALTRLLEKVSAPPAAESPGSIKDNPEGGNNAAISLSLRWNIPLEQTEIPGKPVEPPASLHPVQENDAESGIRGIPTQPVLSVDEGGGFLLPVLIETIQKCLSECLPELSAAPGGDFIRHFSVKPERLDMPPLEDEHPLPACRQPSEAQQRPAESGDSTTILQEEPLSYCIEIPLRVELRLPEEAVRLLRNDHTLSDGVMEILHEADTQAAAAAGLPAFQPPEPAIRNSIRAVQIVLLPPQEEQPVNMQDTADTRHYGEYIPSIIIRRGDAAPGSEKIPDVSPRENSHNIVPEDIKSVRHSGREQSVLARDEDYVHNFAERETEIIKVEISATKDTIRLSSTGCSARLFGQPPGSIPEPDILIDTKALNVALREQGDEVTLRVIFSGDSPESGMMTISRETAQMLLAREEYSMPAGTDLPSGDAECPVDNERQTAVPDTDEDAGMHNGRPVILRIPIEFHQESNAPRFKENSAAAPPQNQENAPQPHRGMRPASGGESPDQMIQTPARTDTPPAEAVPGHKDSAVPVRHVPVVLEGEKPESGAYKVQGMLVLHHNQGSKQNSASLAEGGYMDENGYDKFDMQITHFQESSLENSGQDKRFMNKEQTAAQAQTDRQFFRTLPGNSGATGRVFAFRDIDADVPAAERSRQVWHVEELADNIVRQAKLSKQRGVTEVKVQLVPPHLGKMVVRIRVENQQLMVDVKVETAQAKKIFQENLPQLRNAITNMGMDIQKFDVFVKQDYQDYMNQPHWTGFDHGKSRHSGERGVSNGGAPQNYVSDNQRAELMRSFGYNSMELIA